MKRDIVFFFSVPLGDHPIHYGPQPALLGTSALLLDRRYREARKSPYSGVVTGIRTPFSTLHSTLLPDEPNLLHKMGDCFFTTKTEYLFTIAIVLH